MTLCQQPQMWSDPTPVSQPFTTPLQGPSAPVLLLSFVPWVCCDLPTAVYCTAIQYNKQLFYTTTI